MTTRHIMTTLLLILSIAAVHANTHKTDVLTKSVITGLTTSYSNVAYTAPESGTSYMLNALTANENDKTYIIIRKNENSGIVTTASSGKVESVSITFSSNNSNDRKVKIYGKNEPYTSTADLHASSNATKGSEIGTFTYTEKNMPQTCSINITGDYTHIGIKAEDGSAYFTEIRVTWKSETDITVDAPTYSLPAGKYYGTQSITISGADGAAIYYTTDGSEPTDESTPYTNGITMDCSATLKAIAVIDGVSSPVAEASYTICPLLRTERRAIVSQDYYNQSSYYAMENQAGGNGLKATLVSLKSGIVTTGGDIEWTICYYQDGENETATLQNAEGDYLHHGSVTTISLDKTVFLWTYDSSTKCFKDGTSTLRCDGTSFFATTANGTFSYPASRPLGYTRERGAGNEWGTICLPHALRELTGATLYEITDATRDADERVTDITITEVFPEETVAGMPYMFCYNGKELLATYNDDAAAPATSSNGLYGTLTGITLPDRDGVFLLSGGKIKPAGISDIPANRAYFKLGEITTQEDANPVRSLRFGTDGTVTAIGQPLPSSQFAPPYLRPFRTACVTAIARHLHHGREETAVQNQLT